METDLFSLGHWLQVVSPTFILISSLETPLNIAALWNNSSESNFSSWKMDTGDQTVVSKGRFLSKNPGGTEKTSMNNSEFQPQTPVSVCKQTCAVWLYNSWVKLAGSNSLFVFISPRGLLPTSLMWIKVKVVLILDQIRKKPAEETYCFMSNAVVLEHAPKEAAFNSNNSFWPPPPRNKQCSHFKMHHFNLI